MIVLDASFLIAHLDAHDAHHERALRLLSENADESLGASTVTIAETLVIPARAGLLVDGRDTLEQMGVVELSFGVDAHVRLAELRAKTGHKLPDCCVLMAAKEIGGVVASFDTALTEAAAGLKLVTLS